MDWSVIYTVGIEEKGKSFCKAKINRVVFEHLMNNVVRPLIFRAFQQLLKDALALLIPSILRHVSTACSDQIMVIVF